jgi:hypothetical protein
MWIAIGLAAWIWCACLATYVAAQRGRSPREGFMLGLLFGPMGVVAIGSLPREAVTAEPEAKPRRHSQAFSK